MPFGKQISQNLKYVHVTADNFSNMIVAYAHKDENILDAFNHLLYTVSFLGLSLQLKTDKGPAYTCKCFKEFCNIWIINHVTEIPHNPQGQAIMELHQLILKWQILKREGYAPT